MDDRRRRKEINNPMGESKKLCSHQDRGYAWVVCVAICLQRVLYGGVFHSIGMFYIMFTENLEGDSAVISFVSATNTAAMFGVGPIAGFLISRFGGRKISIVGTLMCSAGLVMASQATQAYQICLTYGVLAGAGIGLQNIATFTIMSVYFNKWLGVASGITAAGTSLGAILFPYLIQHLNDFFGWRGALLTLGGIELHSLLCSALYFKVINREDASKRPGEQIASFNRTAGKPSKNIFLEMQTERKNKEYNEQGSISKSSLHQISKLSAVGRLKYFFSVFHTPVFTVFCGSELCFMMAVSIVYTHIGAYTKNLGFNTDVAVLLFLMIGISCVIAKVLVGLTTQIPRCHPLYICLSSLVLGFITSFFSFYTTLPLLLMYATFFGVLISPYLMLQVTIVKSIISFDKLTIAMGFILFFWAPAYLLGGPVAGWLFDTTGVYLYSFYLASALMVAAGLLDLICIWLIRKPKK